MLVKPELYYNSPVYWKPSWEPQSNPIIEQSDKSKNVNTSYDHQSTVFHTPWGVKVTLIIYSRPVFYKWHNQMIEAAKTQGHLHLEGKWKWKALERTREVKCEIGNVASDGCMEMPHPAPEAERNWWWRHAACCGQFPQKQRREILGTTVPSSGKGITKLSQKKQKQNVTYSSVHWGDWKAMS